MKTSYWFTRSYSTPKTQAPVRQEEEKQKGLTFRKMAALNQTSLKVVEQATEKLTVLTARFGKFRSTNKLYHDHLFSESKQVKEVRCLKHNSQIVLYCFTDSKLLCSACVFGSNEHAKHRINEATSFRAQLEEDIEKQEISFLRSREQVSHTRKIWQDVTINVQSMKQRYIDVLEREREVALACIASLYEKCKNKILDTFQNTDRILNPFSETIETLHKSFKYQHSIASIRHLYHQEVIEQLKEVFKCLPQRQVGVQLIGSLQKCLKAVLHAFTNGLGNLVKITDLQSFGAK